MVNNKVLLLLICPREVPSYHPAKGQTLLKKVRLQLFLCFLVFLSFSLFFLSISLPPPCGQFGSDFSSIRFLRPGSLGGLESPGGQKQARMAPKSGFYYRAFISNSAHF